MLQSSAMQAFAVIAVASLTLLPSVQAGVTSAKLTTTKATTSVPACSKAPYKDLLFVSKYPKAESYCSSKYPPQTSVVTTTVTVTQGAQTSNVATTKKATSSATPKTPTPTCDKACTAWNSATKQAAGFVSTLCSCIETTPTVTATITETVKPKATCGSFTTNWGGTKCGCYYSTSCGSKYHNVTEFLGSAQAETQDDCGSMAGDALARYYNFNLVTRYCEWFNDYTGYKSEPDDENWVNGNRLFDAQPCRGYELTDPWKAGCGCTYDEQCTTDIDGTVISTEFLRYYKECYHKCDLVGPECVAIEYDGYYCTLYSNVTSTEEVGYGPGGVGFKGACDNPCKA